MSTAVLNKLRIGYTCNIRDKCGAEDERYNEWEPPETVEAVSTALVDAGCEVSIIDDGLHARLTHAGRLLIFS